MRQVVLDTETTGLDPSEGHKIVEIGCVEIENRKLTGSHFQVYLNPERDIDKAAIEVHGLTSEFLIDKPRFSEIQDEFLEFVRGAELIIHNAPFDVGFINHELKKANSSSNHIEDDCTILDTLVFARNKHPGQRNSLDALCKRYEVNNTHRELHGALLDAEILADVYLAMTSGQSDLSLKEDASHALNNYKKYRKFDPRRQSSPILYASKEELNEHKLRLKEIDKSSENGCLWIKLDVNT
jgi:DNA polymerase-3 subunit epsilon